MASGAARARPPADRDEVGREERVIKEGQRLSESERELNESTEKEREESEAALFMCAANLAHRGAPQIPARAERARFPPQPSLISPSFLPPSTFL